MTLRYSEVRLDANSIQHLPDGSIKVTGQLTRTGIFKYGISDGGARVEYRPAEEVFSSAAKASFAGATVTYNHPTKGMTRRNVSVDTWKEDAVGHVGDHVRQDGEFLIGDIYVKHPAIIGDIKQGKKVFLSCGYTVRYDPTPGQLQDGTRYDGVQRGITGNHVAILPPGVRPRGGEECQLRLDSEGNEVDALNLGVDIAKLTADLAVAQAQVTALTGEVTKLRTDAIDAGKLAEDLKATTAKVAELEAQLAPERLDALVEERAALVAQAKACGVDAKGKPGIALKRAIVSKNTPALAERCDSLPEAALDAVLATYAAQPHPTLSTVVGAKTPEAAPAPAAPEAPRADSIGEMRKKATAKMHTLCQNDGALGPKGN